MSCSAMTLRPTHILPGLLLACTACVHAAELGDARVASHIGQPLAADVELVLIEDAATAVGVRLADPNVYRGANIAMPAVLAGLDLSVTRRDGRQTLRLRTSEPVQSRHLHVFLELNDGTQRSVRLVTLWLTPDPNPAPPVPAPAMQTVQTVQAPQASVAAVPPVQPRFPMPRPPRAQGAGHDETTPPRTRPAPASRSSTHEAHVPALPHAAPAASACAPAPASAGGDACTALGAKNAVLRQELARLEDRVKGLQATHGVGAGSRAAPGQPEGSPPEEAPRIHLKPKKDSVPEAETPWLLLSAVGVALLALGGGAVLLVRRRRGAARPAPATEEQEGGPGHTEWGLVTRLRARLRPAGRKDKALQDLAPEAANALPGAPE